MKFFCSQREATIIFIISVAGQEFVRSQPNEWAANVQIKKPNDEIQNTPWNPPTIQLEAKDGRNVLNKTLQKHGSQFNQSFGFVFRKFLMPLNSLQFQDMSNVQLLNDVTTTLYTSNQLEAAKTSRYFQLYVSLVPSLNKSDYEANLELISHVAKYNPGVISLVLLDFSSFQVGSLDGFPIQILWLKCSEMLQHNSVLCGFVFDARMCPQNMSFFYFIRLAKGIRIFFNAKWFTSLEKRELSHWKLLSQCNKVMSRSGLRIHGLIENLAVELNQTDFYIQTMYYKQLDNIPLQSVYSLKHLEESLNSTYSNGNMTPYSNVSHLMSSSAILSISLKSLVSLLSLQTSFTDRSPRDQRFFEHFSRFLIEICDISTEESKDQTLTESFANIFTSIKEYILKNSDHYVPPLSLWLSFTPKGNITEELVIMFNQAQIINLIIPDLIKYIVLDYKNLRVNRDAYSVVSRDIKECEKFQGNDYKISCAYIFHKRNCFQSNDAFTRLPFIPGSLVLLRDTQDVRCKSAPKQVTLGGYSKAGGAISVDPMSGKFNYSKFGVLVLESHYFYIIAEIDDGCDADGAQFDNPLDFLKSTSWLHADASFSKKNTGIAVQHDDIPNTQLLKLVSQHETIVLETTTSVAFNIVGLCKENEWNHKSNVTVYIVLESGNFTQNMESFDRLLLNIDLFEKKCGKLISEILIDWLPCFDSEPWNCNKTEMVYQWNHFKAVSDIIMYLKVEKKLSTNLAITLNPDTVESLSFTTDGTYKWLNDSRTITGSDTIQHYRSVDVYSTFDIPQVLQTLSKVERFAFIQDIPFYDMSDNPYSLAQLLVRVLESWMRRIDEIYYGSHMDSRKYENTQIFIVKIFACEYNKTAEDRLMYARFWEIVTNWAVTMDQIVVLDSLDSIPSKHCGKIEMLLGTRVCTCGWWSTDNVTNDVIDAKSLGRKQFLKLDKPKVPSLNTDINSELYLTSGITIPIVLVTITLLCGGIIYVKHYRKINILTRDQVNCLLAELNKSTTESHNGGNFKPKSTIKQNDLEIGIGQENHVGSGESGTIVRRGLLKSSNQPDKNVAVKLYRPPPGSREVNKTFMIIRGLVKEAAILSRLEQHVNVVRLFGYSIQNMIRGEMLLVLEYCEFGSLHSFLRANRLTTEFVENGQGSQPPDYRPSILELMKAWCLQIACGLQYLSSNQIVHNDIATRNILLDSSKCCKISDFGLSRWIENCESDDPSNEVLKPWRWMSPEALMSSATDEKTDVWMFGVTVWEIYSFAEVPFGGFVWNTDFPKMLLTGLRLEIPELMPTECVTLVRTCWEKYPNERPTFSLCLDSLK